MSYAERIASGNWKIESQHTPSGEWPIDIAREADAELARKDEQISGALNLAFRYGGIDGAHHKAWVIDQMVRALTGDKYAGFVADAKAGEDGPDTYEWDEGVAP